MLAKLKRTMIREDRRSCRDLSLSRLVACFALAPGCASISAQAVQTREDEQNKAMLMTVTMRRSACPRREQRADAGQSFNRKSSAAVVHAAVCLLCLGVVLTFDGPR